MPAYATEAQLASYVEGWVTDNSAAVGRLLERSSRDIDSVLSDLWVLESNGLRLGDLASGANPKLLTAGEILAVQYATCAQAEYRWMMGEEFFARDQPQFIAGPDFQQRGALSKIGPKALLELEKAGLSSAGDYTVA